MRIAFIGAVEFSRHCLEEVLRCGGDVVCVFTLDRKDAESHSDYAPLSDNAERHGIPNYLVRNINDPDTVELIKGIEPDVIFVFGWSQIVSKEILDIPPLGCIGTHPALLPRNRGRHPLVWALVEGLPESGLTFFYLDEGADSGDILWQRAFPITLDDDAGTLYRKIEALAGEAIHEFLPQLESGTAPRLPQDHTKATYWRRRREKDGEIRWDAPTMTTYNLVRALTRPYVGAHTFVNGKRVLVWRTKLPSVPPSSDDALGRPPGTVFRHSQDGFHVRTGDGHLVVTEHEALEGQGLVLGARLMSPP